MQTHDIQCRKTGIKSHEQRRDYREILRHVIGNREGRKASAGHEELLADSYNVDELCRRGVEVDHVSGFLCRLSTGIHRDGDVSLRQRRRVIRAVSGHRDEMSLALIVAYHRKLALGSRFGEKIVNSGFGGYRSSGYRVVAGDHDGFDSHFAQIGELFLYALLDDIL